MPVTAAASPSQLRSFSGDGVERRRRPCKKAMTNDERSGDGGDMQESAYRPQDRSVKKEGASWHACRNKRQVQPQRGRQHKQSLTQGRTGDVLLDQAHDVAAMRGQMPPAVVDGDATGHVCRLPETGKQNNRK